MTVANRRRGADRRVKRVAVDMERRSGLDRRMIVESATAALRDDSRRLLDTAMLRLRFALERMEPE